MNLNKKKMLITGVSGLLGNNLAYCLKDDYDIVGFYNEHSFQIDGIQTVKVNLLDENSIKNAIKEFSPDVVVHSAAISDVDISEREPELAEAVNVRGTQNIVRALEGTNTKLIYISTDLVYGESNGKALREEEPVNPVNQYGRTKYRGEQISLKRPGTMVLRTNFFGWNIQPKFSLAEWIVHELRQNKKIKGFQDVKFSGIYTFDFARALKTAFERDLTGVYNLASRNSVSKFDFAVQLARYFHLDEDLIQPSSIDEFDFAAQRRKNLSLDVTKIESALQSHMPTVEETIEHFHEDFEQFVVEKIRVCTHYPRLDHIPYGRQSINADDIQAVIDVLKSSNLTQGPKVQEFEEQLGSLTGAKYAVATNSGTSALHIACVAAGVKSGDEVITSPNSFVASANCAVYCGAQPVFADIDGRTFNISPEELQNKITKKTKAVIPVHFAGQSADMEKISNIVRKHSEKFGHKISVIEDAAHALGSQYKKQPVGSCRFSDMAVMSFHPVKHITTGEGGVVLTNDEGLLKKLRMLRSHGITSISEDLTLEDNAFEHVDDGSVDSRAKKPWYYEQQLLGFNYRITDLQCALGISQLKRLPLFMQRRREIAHKYTKRFKNLRHVSVPYESSECQSNFHLYVLKIDFRGVGMTRAFFMKELKSKGIHTQVHYIPVHTQPFYQKIYKTKKGDYPQTEDYYEHCLSIPLYPAMTDQDVEKVIDTITALVQG